MYICDLTSFFLILDPIRLQSFFYQRFRCFLKMNKPEGPEVFFLERLGGSNDDGFQAGRQAGTKEVNFDSTQEKDNQCRKKERRIRSLMSQDDVDKQVVQSGWVRLFAMKSILLEDSWF
jgi:hypothetical protein